MRIAAAVHEDARNEAGDEHAEVRSIAEPRALDQHAVDASLLDESRVGVRCRLALAVVLRENDHEAALPRPVERAADDRRVDGVAE